MKIILRLAAASALLAMAGYASAEPASPDHANHNHGAPAASPTPAPTPSATPAAKPCDHSMSGGAPMGGMSGMQGMSGMNHQHMMNGEMKGCEHMMHGGTTTTPPASPTPPKP